MRKATEAVREFARSHSTAVLLLGGLAGGMANGLLGAGSGIVFIFLVSFLFSPKNAEEQKAVYALSLCAVFFITLFSVVFYYMRGKIDLPDAMPYILPAAVGGLAGAMLLPKIKISLLRVIFGILIIYSGIKML